ncbi:MAG: hypothetical protein EOO22_05855 [Comamonadaceae bacterium]|nr:MAG: hypothetical protein EOO22_05855 [Comamonadaceae bacterium]
MHPCALLMRRLAWTGALAGAMLASTSAWSVVERLDDSSSPRSQVTASLDDERAIAALRAPASPIVRVSFGRVQYRLATARYAGRQARIYYVLPPAVPGLRSAAGLQVQWRTEGLFASGTGRPGDRIPVWNGVVRDAWMSESLDLSWQLDLRELRVVRGAPIGFEAYFEIETLP